MSSIYPLGTSRLNADMQEVVFHRNTMVRQKYKQFKETMNSHPSLAVRRNWTAQRKIRALQSLDRELYKFRTCPDHSFSVKCSNLSVAVLYAVVISCLEAR